MKEINLFVINALD